MHDPNPVSENAMQKCPTCGEPTPGDCGRESVRPAAPERGEERCEKCGRTRAEAVGTNTLCTGRSGLTVASHVWPAPSPSTEPTSKQSLQVPSPSTEGEDDDDDGYGQCACLTHFPGAVTWDYTTHLRITIHGAGSCEDKAFRPEDYAAPSPALPVSAQRVVLNLAQAQQLIALFGGDDSDIELTVGDGHSGRGLYAHFDGVEEEGSWFLGNAELAPPAPALPVSAEAPDRCPHNVPWNTLCPDWSCSKPPAVSAEGSVPQCEPPCGNCIAARNPSVLYRHTYMHTLQDIWDRAEKDMRAMIAEEHELRMAATRATPPSDLPALAGEIAEEIRAT